MAHPFLVFKKDLKRFRFFILSWVLVVCLVQGLTLLGVTLLKQHITYRIYLPLLLEGMCFLQGLLMFIYIPRIVQADPTVGTTAFWMTRPVSRLSLFFAKAMLVFGFFAGIPLSVELVVLAVSRIPARLLWLAVPEILLEKSLLIVPVFLAACLTERFHKFILLTILLLLSLFIAWPFLSGLLVGMFFPGSRPDFVWGRSLFPSLSQAGLTQNISVVAAGIILILHQYLTRRTKRTVLGLFAGLVMMTVAVHSFPGRKVPSEIPGESPSNIRVEKSRVSVSEDMKYNNRLSRERIVNININVQGLPLGQFAVLRDAAQAHIVYGQDVRLESTMFFNHPRVSIASRDLQSPIQYALKDYIVMNPYEQQENSYEMFRLAETDYEQYKNLSGTYRARGTFDVYQYRLSLKMPLKRGGSARSGKTDVMILDIIEKPSGVTVIVGEKTANMAFAPKSGRAGTPFDREDSYTDFTQTYVLSHPRKRQAFLLDMREHTASRIDAGWPVSHGRLVFKVKRYDFKPVDAGGNSYVKLNASWLKEAELIRLDAVQAGAFRRDMEFSGFYLPEFHGRKK